MKITRRFTKSGVDVFSMVEWTVRSSRIVNPDGSVVFEMNDAEVPRSWSQLATDIMVSKYFRKAGVPQRDEKGQLLRDADGGIVTGPEKSARQVIHRLAGCWREWGENHRYFNSGEDAQAFYDEIAWMLLTQVAAPNSPQWFNTGLAFAYGVSGPAQGHYYVEPETGETKLAEDAYTHPQPHACFIQSIDDDLVNSGGIMDLWVREARLFKYGSGTGTNFSKLRAAEESLSGGGKSSGLMSWLKIGDRAAGAIKSGGTTRRAAKMVCLDIDHPDIETFVNWKVREELKVAAMVEGAKRLPKAQRETLEKLGMKLDLDFNGEAYATVSGQNSNNSVRVSNSFFDRLDEDGWWELTFRTNGEVAKRVRARDLWDQIGYAAWRCADPGVQFDSTINQWHTCPASGRINASNPCVTGDTLVSTSTGYRRIGDLVGQSAEVIDGERGVSFVDRIFKTGTKPVYELKTRSGYALKLTADHKVRTENRGDVAACELTVDDVVSLRGAGFGDDWLSDDVAEWLGRCLVEGVPQGLSSGVPDPVSTAIEVWDTYAFGQDQDLKLTDRFFDLCKDSQAAILRGFLAATDKTVVVLSEELARQLQLALLSFGVKAEIETTAWADGFKTRLCSLRAEHNAHQLISGSVFVGVGGSSQMSDTCEKALTDYVASLTGCGVEDVFDLTEPRTSHFVANGIVVHNCSEYMFLDNTACNLASINLLRLYDAEARTFDMEGFEHAIRLWTVVLEISVLMAAFPSKEIARLSHEYRTLGLGYANLGAMLMQAGIPYDSEMARAIAGAISAVMTGRSYASSAEMAAEHGPFPGYFKNREHMLRVIRNHRRAAYGVPRKSDAVLGGSEDDVPATADLRHGLGWYEGLEIPPVPIAGELLEGAAVDAHGHLSNGDELLRGARRAWDDALREGEAHGYRNAQTTVIAPTGTIGLLMDCDTTGVEPDFALVKFKKLAGGGYFKIANQSLKPALKSLGYQPDEIHRIMTYVMGSLSLDVAMPDDNGRIAANPTDTFADYLTARGATAEDLKKITDALAGSMELRFAFNALTLGEGMMKRLGVEGAEDIAAALGLSKRQIESLNEQVCGTGTIEGAPGLKAEHLAVFDCANKCGRKGVRFIAAAGHIRMMAAAQPFVSGAISKTINLPNEADVEDIKAAYRMSWELGLKANALYRDGSKLSQVLSATADDAIEAEVEDEEGIEAAKTEVAAEVSAAAGRIAGVANEEEAVGVLKQIIKIEERIVERPLRRRLANTRRSITHKFNVAGHEGYLTVGLYEDGNPGELFLTMAKEGSTIGGLMDSLGTAISVALQYGVPVESLVHKFTHQRFEPAGMTDNKDIPFAKSLVDYIFRWMGMEFIAGYREANAPKRPAPKPAEVKAPEVKSTEIAAAETKATVSSQRTESPSAEKLDRAGVGQGGVAPAVYASHEEGGNGNGNGGNGNGEHGGRLRDVEPVGSRVAIDDPQIAHAHQVRRSPLSSMQSKAVAALAVVDRANATAAAMVTTLNAVNSEFMGDAPACDVCGSITVRNGTCYKCLNCGNSMGCS